MSGAYVTSSAAARACGVTVRTLQRWHAAGFVRAEADHTGGHHRWDVAELRVAVSAYRDGPEPEFGEDGVILPYKIDMRGWPRPLPPEASVDGAWPDQPR